MSDALPLPANHSVVGDVQNFKISSFFFQGGEIISKLQADEIPSLRWGETYPLFKSHVTAIEYTYIGIGHPSFIQLLAWRNESPILPATLLAFR